MDIRRRRACGLLIAVALFATTARGDDLKPEELKKAYDDALVQLKAAQERKNQLAAENEKLTAQLAELQKQIAQMTERMEEMKRTDAEHAEKTFFLRSHYAAWQEFIRGYPELYERWRVYLGNDLLWTPRLLPEGIHLDLPLEEDERNTPAPRGTSRPLDDEPGGDPNC